MTSSLGPPALAAVSSPLHAVSPATPAMPIAAPLRTDRRLNMFCSVSALTWLGALNVWWRPSKDDCLAVPWSLPIARPEQSVLKGSDYAPHRRSVASGFFLLRPLARIAVGKCVGRPRYSHGPWDRLTIFAPSSAPSTGRWLRSRLSSTFLRSG